MKFKYAALSGLHDFLKTRSAKWLLASFQCMLMIRWKLHFASGPGMGLFHHFTRMPFGHHVMVQQAHSQRLMDKATMRMSSVCPQHYQDEHRWFQLIEMQHDHKTFIWGRSVEIVASADAGLTLRGRRHVALECHKFLQPWAIFFHASGYGSKDPQKEQSHSRLAYSQCMLQLYDSFWAIAVSITRR